LLYLQLAICHLLIIYYSIFQLGPVIPLPKTTTAVSTGADFIALVAAILYNVNIQNLCQTKIVLLDQVADITTPLVLLKLKYFWTKHAFS
jgi:hypothetical protein